MTIAPQSNESLHLELANAERAMRAGQVDEALAACNALMPRLRTLGDAVALGACEHVIAAGHQYAGRIDEALLAGYRSIGWLTGTEAVDRLLKVMALQAGGLARIGASPEALELLDQAIRLLTGRSTPAREQCVFWSNASAAYDALQQFPRALDAANRALDLTGDFDDPDLLVVCQGNVLSIGLESLCQAHVSDPAAIRAALEPMDRHLDQLVAHGQHHLVSFFVEPAADALMLLGDRVAARRWLRRGIESTQLTGALPAQGLLELRLAQLDRLEGAYDSAAAHLAQALDESVAGQTEAGRERLFQEQSLLCEARGDWKGALASYKKRSELREAALRLQADVRTQALSMRLDVERGRLEAELLRRKNDELQQGLSRLADQAGVLEKQAMEDPLTGLANRRELERAVQRLTVAAPGRPLTLLMADIDHFKRINDGFSHAVGDTVLQAFASVLRDASRPGDVVCRIGGEEFVVVLPDFDPVQSTNIAERLRSSLESHAWANLQAGLVVTASIGVSAIRPGQTLAESLARADSALYACKREGRNCVRLSD